MAFQVALAVLLVVGIFHHETNAAATCSKKIDDRCVCGLQNKDDRILNGQEAKAFEFPWLAAIVFKGTRTPNCTGSVINNKYVLTTASCIQLGNLKPGSIDVLTHMHDRSKTDEDENSQRYGVAEIIKHDKFKTTNEGGFLQYDYDLALLKLSDKIDFTEANTPIPICLPEGPKQGFDISQIKITLAGWGAEVEAQEKVPTTTLKKIDPPMVSDEKCSSADFYGSMYKAMAERSFCAGREGGDTCGQDTGAPAVAQFPEMPGQHIAVGVASWGHGCSRKNKPTVFAKLCQYIDWIVDVSSCKDNAMWCKQKK